MLEGSGPQKPCHINDYPSSHTMYCSNNFYLMHTVKWGLSDWQNAISQIYFIYYLSSIMLFIVIILFHHSLL